MWYYPAEAAGNNWYSYLPLQKLPPGCATGCIVYIYIAVSLPSGKVTLLLPSGLKALG